MGMLIDGVWRGDADRFIRNGAFCREVSGLPLMTASELAEHMRVTPTVLIASKSCPWSHRTLLVRAVKQLDYISIVIAGEPRVEGYALSLPHQVTIEGKPVAHVHQLYSATDPAFQGRATVPLLWDSAGERIVCNDSATIARALDLMSQPVSLLNPSEHFEEIETLNARIYSGLSNTVYRAGLAETQAAYDAAVQDVFATLDWLEVRLTARRYLLGAQITEADFFLFATLVRFDVVYNTLFRCTRRRLTDYPALWVYARDLFAQPGVAETVDFAQIRDGYYLNDGDSNPHQILPDLPDIDWTEPHGRDCNPIRVEGRG